MDQLDGPRLFRIPAAPYQALFKTVRTHLLMAELSKAAILNALRAGHAYLAADTVGDATGFVFRAESGDHITGIMGDEITWQPGLTLLMHAPTKARLRLFKDGALVEERRAQTWRYAVESPGIYRVEADLRRQFWIAANPIYVRTMKGGQ